MNNDFKLKSELVNNSLVLKTSGYVNNEGGEKIITEFNKQFQAGIINVIIDFSDSKVVNSIGISYLLEIIEKLVEQKGNIILTNMASAVEKSFTIMGLFRFAEKAESIDDALKMIEKNG